MANERREVIRVSITGSDGRTLKFEVSKKLDQTDTTPDVDARFITVAITEADLAFEHITQGGVVCMENLGDTNVEYGPKVAGNMQDFAAIAPGETHKLRLKDAVVVLRWVSITSTNVIKLWAADA